MMLCILPPLLLGRFSILQWCSMARQQPPIMTAFPWTSVGGGCCGFDADLPPPPDNNKGWRIGKVFLVSNRVFQGLLDEVYIYDRALSQSEIVTLASLSPPSTCETDLAQCEADLTECLTNPIIPDQDEDGEPDATDECPNTPADAPVDPAGCSLEQFCSSSDA